LGGDDLKDDESPPSSDRDDNDANSNWYYGKATKEGFLYVMIWALNRALHIWKI
jgi:hypothetical protein